MRPDIENTKLGRLALYCCLPVLLLVLLPLALPLMIITFVIILPYIPIAYLISSEPQESIRNVISWPVHVSEQ